MATTDLNHMKLPPVLIADLYKNTIIDTAEADPVPEQPVHSEPGPSTIPLIKSLGENRRQVVVIVNYNESVHLPDHDLEFMTGILGACKLALADVAIVNLHNHPELTYKELASFFKPKIVLLFAVEPASFGLPMSFPYFQIQPFSGSSFLFSPSLPELEDDKILKSKLWVCLKRLFNL